MAAERQALEGLDDFSLGQRLLREDGRNSVGRSLPRPRVREEVVGRAYVAGKR